MFLLIFNEQRVLKITFVLVLTYYVKPHLFVILTAIGWFIVNIQSDLFSHRCLERQAFGTPWMYTLSPSKCIKGSNYGEFLKDKNVLLCTRLYKYTPNLESLLTQQYVCVMCTLWSDNTCVFTRFHSIKNANTQLIWSFDYVIKFVSDLQQVGGFLHQKTDHHDITKILLKVALNTITLIPLIYNYEVWWSQTHFFVENRYLC